MIIHPCKSIKGEITVPGDKSISHRSIMLGAIADGMTVVEGFLMSGDCLSTIECFRKLGVEISLTPAPSPSPGQRGKSRVKIYGKGLRGLAQPPEILNVGNSGTTVRLMAGILVGQLFASTIDGDKSIRKRPMKRIIEPLVQMGAQVNALQNAFAPLTVTGGKLKGINYTSPIASAQVKSCILLASLYADNETIFTEPILSRNHTELMLQSFGGRLDIKDNTIKSSPIQKLTAQQITVPGDISSAALFITLGLICPNSEVTIKNVGLNPTRTGILDVYKEMGGKINIENEREINNEPVGDITVFSSELKGVEIGGDLIPRLIDEIPVIAVAATQAVGATVITDAGELKVKESNRIKSVFTALSKMGADIEEIEDGMIINGPTVLQGAEIDSYSDHRIAMSGAVAGKIAGGETVINGAECVDISFPGFFEVLDKVCE